jgi:hypothetical protein
MEDGGRRLAEEGVTLWFKDKRSRQAYQCRVGQHAVQLSTPSATDRPLTTRGQTGGRQAYVGIMDGSSLTLTA